MKDTIGKAFRDWDLRKVCVHEYSHFAVAQLLGYTGYVTVYENRGAASDDRHFLGGFHMVERFTAPHHKVLVGLAGTVAEAYYDDPKVTAYEIWSYLDDGTMQLSESDAALACGYTESDIGSCIQLVEQAWPQILDSTQLRETVFQ